MIFKKCSKCGKNLPLSFFHKAKGGMNGLRANCKICVKMGVNKGKPRKKFMDGEYIPKKGDSFRAFVRYRHKEHCLSPFLCSLVDKDEGYIEAGTLRFCFPDYYFMPLRTPQD